MMLAEVALASWWAPPAFVKEANNLLDEGAGDKNELSFWVVRTLEDDDSVVERCFNEQLCEPFEVATEER